MWALWIVLLLLSAKLPGSDAGAMVRAVEKHYGGVRTLKAVFIERYSDGPRNIRLESGTVYFSRPGRMRWEYESPEEKLFLADGKHVWFYVPADRAATRTRVRDSAEWQTPFAILTGNAKFGRFCGRVELLPAERAGAGEKASSADHVVLRCLPKSADAPFREVLIEVDSQARLSRVLVREVAGIETEFRFARWVENTPLAEVLFHFSPPRGVAIVEDATVGRGVH